MNKNIIKKAFENKSFVDYLNYCYAKRLKLDDEWGGSNLSGFIAMLAETESDCCGIPEIAFKRYQENEEDWENAYKNRETDQFLSEVYDLIEEKEFELYLTMSSEANNWLEFIPNDVEAVAAELSSMMSLDNKDHTQEWIEDIKDAAKGVQWS
jgi:hypothetical protein